MKMHVRAEALHAAHSACHIRLQRPAQTEQVGPREYISGIRLWLSLCCENGTKLREREREREAIAEALREDRRPLSYVYNLASRLRSHFLSPSRLVLYVGQNAIIARFRHDSLSLSPLCTKGGFLLGSCADPVFGR